MFIKTSEVFTPLSLSVCNSTSEHNDEPRNILSNGYFPSHPFAHLPYY